MISSILLRETHLYNNEPKPHSPLKRIDVTASVPPLNAMPPPKPIQEMQHPQNHLAQHIQFLIQSA
jgi:hypothetical protein